MQNCAAFVIFCVDIISIIHLNEILDPAGMKKS